MRVIGLPSTETTMSPGWIPAAAAGELGATSSTRTWPVGATVPIANAAVSTTTARTKFMKTPAARTIACAHHGFDGEDLLEVRLRTGVLVLAELGATPQHRRDVGEGNVATEEALDRDLVGGGDADHGAEVSGMRGLEDHREGWITSEVDRAE